MTNTITLSLSLSELATLSCSAENHLRTVKRHAAQGGPFAPSPQAAADAERVRNLVRAELKAAKAATKNQQAPTK